MNSFRLTTYTLAILRMFWAQMVEEPQMTATPPPVDRVIVTGANVKPPPPMPTTKAKPAKATKAAKAPTPSKAKCTYTPPSGMDGMVAKAASTYHVNANAILLTIYRESGCNPRMVGGSGEIGLGQILPSVWTATLKKAGILSSAQDLFDPSTNIRATAYILSQLRKSYGTDPYMVFMRYNGSGPLARTYATEQLARYKALFGAAPKI